MPRVASQVIGLRTWIFSICMSSSFRAASTVIISFSRTTTSSVIGLTMLTRLTRPRIDWPRRDLDLLALVDDALGDPLAGAAVLHRDDDVLGHVGELAGQVARVGRLRARCRPGPCGHRGSSEKYSSTRQAFAEVGLDRRLDDLARGLGHQAAHAGELADLLDAAAGARLGHQEDRVEVDLAVADVVLELLHHLGGDLLAGVGPGVEDLVVPLLLGDDAALVELGCLGDLLLGLGEDLRPWSRGS